MKPDMYFSCDIEADGPIPGEYSMISIGMSVAGTFDGETFKRVNPIRTIYLELAPISCKFVPEALAVSGLDRKLLVDEGMHPSHAMNLISNWVKGEAEDKYSPIFVAWPLSFDWMFVYWYFQKFDIQSPFGFSGCLDMKTMYHRLANVVMRQTVKSKMPKEYKSSKKHTHNALDDAIEQAEIFGKLFEATMKKQHQGKFVFGDDINEATP